MNNEKINMQFEQTKLCRIIPKSNLNESDDINEWKDPNFKRWYSVDGERYKIEPIQIKMKSKHLKVFCLNGN